MCKTWTLNLYVVKTLTFKLQFYMYNYILSIHMFIGHALCVVGLWLCWYLIWLNIWFLLVFHNNSYVTISPRYRNEISFQILFLLQFSEKVGSYHFFFTSNNWCNSDWQLFLIWIIWDRNGTKSMKFFVGKINNNIVLLIICCEKFSDGIINAHNI